MSTTSLIVLALIGIVAGWMAGKLMKGKGFGLIGDLIIGVAGSFLGAWLFGLLHISIESGLVGSFVTALVGALVLLYVLRLIKA
jgi:uncharacterized membrane protein YeaQ/YmgE (transglycosylase-associated protein family)